MNASVSSVLCFIESSLQRLALLFDHYGLDMKDLPPEQKDNVPVAMKQLQLERAFANKQPKGLCLLCYDFNFAVSRYATNESGSHSHLLSSLYYVFVFTFQINLGTMLTQERR